MLSTTAAPPTGALKASYNIYFYTDGIYKIIHFKGDRNRDFLSLKTKDVQKYDFKLDPAISRAKRVVLELALCNEWKYFATFTLDKTKYDRNDLAKWHKHFLQWIRDQRKASGLKIDFLLVPELHQDGAWHMHGLFSDISPVLVSFAQLAAEGRQLPWKLISGDYYNWCSYEKKFGYCSFGVIRDRIATAFYCTKYLTKSVCESTLAVGSHLYYPSRGLNRSVLHGEVYGDSAFLNSFLTNKYEFVETGFTARRDNCDWSFAVDLMDYEQFQAFTFDADADIPDDLNDYFEGCQCIIENF